MLFNPNQWIENVNYITVTNHMKNMCFYTIIEVNNPVLNDCGITIFHHIWKHLKMFQLIITWWIKIHHVKIYQTDLYNCNKVINENIPPLCKFD
jgi:hypothetical protein